MSVGGRFGLVKVSVVTCAVGAHGWLFLPNAPVGVMFASLPYLLLFFAWDYLATGWLVAMVVAILIASEVSAMRAYWHSTSSTSGVALVLQSLLGCVVVGFATLVRFTIESWHGRR